MKFKLYAKKFIRILLMLIFRFDWWHTSPLENRKYAIDIITELNQKLERESIIELGCGLGDIVGNAKYKKRYFYDISENVLNAAKYLQFYSRSKAENSYRVFDFFRDALSSNLKFDAIVIVNWIHGYDQIVLRKNLDKIIYNKKSDLVYSFGTLQYCNNYKEIISQMISASKKFVIFDLRNIYSSTKIEDQGFKYFSVGK